VSDCEWLRELHSVGRLRASFRPAAAIVPLRSFLRQRETLVEETTTRINRMHKALTEMNLKLDSVLTDINQTGLRIIRAILGEERNPERLAAHRDHRCHASQAEIVAALTGNYRAEQLFALKQNFAAYEFLLQQVAECDAEIEALLTSLAAQQPPPPTALPPTRSKARPQHGQPRFEIRSPLQQLSGGVDLSQIDAIGPHAALQLVAEIGTDMHRWQTEKHFTAWLALAPNNRVSGGRRLSSRTPSSANRAAAILRRCAMSLTRTALGAFYRRLATRTGKPKAITATARKLAVLVYRVLSGNLLYNDPAQLLTTNSIATANSSPYTNAPSC